MTKKVLSVNSCEEKPVKVLQNPFRERNPRIFLDKWFLSQFFMSSVINHTKRIEVFQEREMILPGGEDLFE